MSYLTIEYAGNEKQLADWGIDQSSPSLTLISQSTDVLSVNVPQAKIDDPELFAFEAAIIFRINRASATGAVNSFSGGTTEFQGVRMLQILDGRPSYEGVTYQFGGPWYHIEKVCYQQHCLFWDGVPDGVGTTDQLFSDVFLFYDAPTNYFINTGQQATKILQHVLTMYAAQGMTAPFQLGAVSGGTVNNFPLTNADNGIAAGIDLRVNVPHYPVQDIMCSEALANCLRSSPDATVYFDYSVQPPKIIIAKDDASFTPVSFAVGGSNHKSIRLTPRPDLVARSVLIVFKVTGDDNGVTWVQKVKQKYGPSGDGSADLPGTGDPEGGLRVVVQTIDMQGSSRSDVTGYMEVRQVKASDLFGQAAIKAWWALRKDSITDDFLRNFTWNAFTDVIVKDANGFVLNSTDGTVAHITSGLTNAFFAQYPNEITKGGWAQWMKRSDNSLVAALEVTISTDVLFEEWSVADDGSHTNGKRKHVRRKKFSCKVKLTNAFTTDSPYYSALASFTAGEQIPVDLAKAIYQSLAVLQYEGEDIRLEEEVTGLIGMQNVLNLTGGLVAWQTMQAQIQSITKQYGNGQTSVTIGPAKHLSAGEMKDIFLFNRFRRTYYNPATRNSGKMNNAAIVQFPQENQIENTSEGLSDNEVQTTSSGY